MTTATCSKISVGISACLLGDEVRYNGGHKRSHFCADTLSEFFNFKKFCPEVEAGFGIPRPTLRLTGNPQQPTLSYSDDNNSDHTLRLIEVSQPYIKTLDQLDGYILQQKSPSCGMERVKVYAENGTPQTEMSAGLFAKQLMQDYPHLPVEEEGRLHDDDLRENFIARVYAHHNFRQMVLEDPSHHALIEFHSQYKYILMAHQQTTYRALGRLISQSTQGKLAALIDQYWSQMMLAMKGIVSRGNHYNTMLHIFGYVKNSLDSECKQLVIKTLDQYLAKEINLQTAMTLLNHYIQLHGNDYIKKQKYLNPYPQTLALRNTI